MVDYADELANLAVEYDGKEKLLGKLTEALAVKAFSEVSELRETVLLLLQKLEKKDADVLVLKERCVHLQKAYNRDCLKVI